MNTDILSEIKTKSQTTHQAKQQRPVVSASRQVNLKREYFQNQNPFSSPNLSWSKNTTINESIPSNKIMPLMIELKLNLLSTRFIRWQREII
jgi:hypothetical protein